MVKYTWSCFSAFLPFLALFQRNYYVSGLERSCLLPWHYHEGDIKLKPFPLNCTHVVGNIRIVNRDDDEWIKYDDFLTNIEEVTGYVHIDIEYYRSTPRNISFPNLRTIRGDSLFKVNLDDPGYALLLKEGNERESNYTIEFPALREISNGGVGIFTSQRMCYLETINWRKIIADRNAYYHYFPHYDWERRLHTNPAVNESDNNCKNINCHPSCGSGCWGEGHQKCQRSACSGISIDDCAICKNVQYDGECRVSCPAGKYVFRADCVDSCPDGSLIDEEAHACLAYCPESKLKVDGKCAQIPPYLKKCKSQTAMTYINPLTIKRFQNCNLYQGSISIYPKLWDKIVYYHNYTYSVEVEEFTREELDVLNNIRMITGSFSMFKMNYSRLQCFKNLEVVGGGFYVTHTELESLDFPALRRVHGTIGINFNEHLCYGDTVSWSNISVGNYPTKIFFNKYNKDCKKKGKICSKLCSSNGCSGPEVEQCICLDYFQEGKCVFSCDLKNGYIRDGRYCVKSCPEGKYELNGECIYCHDSCKNGCTGPGEFVGSGGCNFCSLPSKINEDMGRTRTCHECLSENDRHLPQQTVHVKTTSNVLSLSPPIIISGFFILSTVTVGLVILYR